MIFCAGEVLGHPNKIEFLKRVKEILKANPDMVEFSIPFSDPSADGPVIQKAHELALQSGVTVKMALELVKEVRKITTVPIFLIIYLNIFLQYGVEKMYKALKKAGVQNILIPDLPLEEIEPFAKAAKQNNLNQILIVSENTSVERLRKIVKISGSMLYVVSTLGVTGSRKDLDNGVTNLIARLKKHTKIPLMIGFGISKPEHVDALKKARADAVVVCSAFVKTATNELKELVKELKGDC